MKAEELLIKKLKKLKLTIGSVESMTGGAFSKAITDIAGASEVYKGSLICYCNELKTNLLNISEELIIQKGAVSYEVAKLMAQEGMKILKTDLCISFTGNAGPGILPGEEGVGVCYIGIATKNTMEVEKIEAKGSRKIIRNKIISVALEKLNQKIS